MPELNTKSGTVAETQEARFTHCIHLRDLTGSQNHVVYFDTSAEKSAFIHGMQLARNEFCVSATTVVCHSCSDPTPKGETRA